MKMFAFLMLAFIESTSNQDQFINECTRKSLAEIPEFFVRYVRTCVFGRFGMLGKLINVFILLCFRTSPIALTENPYNRVCTMYPLNINCNACNYLFI